MAKRVKEWTEEMNYNELTSTTTCRVRYTCDDDVETDMTKYGELTFTVTDGNTVTQEKTAILNAIKTQEGIS